MLTRFPVKENKNNEQRKTLFRFMSVPLLLPNCSKLKFICGVIFRELKKGEKNVVLVEVVKQYDD